MINDRARTASPGVAGAEPHHGTLEDLDLCKLIRYLCPRLTEKKERLKT